MTRLGVNVDHVATIRQARGTAFPDPVEAAGLAIRGGADQITIHLREDRRHIQERDLRSLLSTSSVPVNLEMAASPEIVSIACDARPHSATLVPEKRMELTTEGGLDVAGNFSQLKGAVHRLLDAGIRVSMFIDPEKGQADASIDIGAAAVEFHTGSFCDATTDEARAAELERLVVAVRYASGKKIEVCAGHGLNYENTAVVVRAMPEIVEYNIGHSIVARAIFVGMEEAVREMKSLVGRPS